MTSSVKSSIQKPPDGFSSSRIFNIAAQWTSQQSGRAPTFVVACGVIVVWAIMGPVFKYSDSWQLVINTGTTIITFLMVFLIQNTQNRDMTTLQFSESARNRLLDLDGATEEELHALKASFTRLAGDRDRMSTDIAEIPEPAHRREQSTSPLEHATCSNITARGN